jgi:hypothetical protein
MSKTKVTFEYLNEDVVYFDTAKFSNQNVFMLMRKKESSV